MQTVRVHIGLWTVSLIGFGRRSRFGFHRIGGAKHGSWSAGIGCGVISALKRSPGTGRRLRIELTGRRVAEPRPGTIGR